MACKSEDRPWAPLKTGFRIRAERGLRSSIFRAPSLLMPSSGHRFLSLLAVPFERARTVLLNLHNMGPMKNEHKISSRFPIHAASLQTSFNSDVGQLPTGRHHHTCDLCFKTDVLRRPDS